MGNLISILLGLGIAYIIYQNKREESQPYNLLPTRETIEELNPEGNIIQIQLKPYVSKKTGVTITPTPIKIDLAKIGKKLNRKITPKEYPFLI